VCGRWYTSVLPIKGEAVDHPHEEPTLTDLTAAARELCAIAPQELLEDLSSENPLRRAEAWALTSLADWDASDLFLLAMDRAAGGE
jgi:hypothetical protein